jgi:hypothetical protein
MTNNTRKYKITSILRMYHLDYIVDFPTSIDTYLASIDNIFLDKSRNKNHTIEQYHNGLSNCDALMLTLYKRIFKVEVNGRECIRQKYDLVQQP